MFCVNVYARAQYIEPDILRLCMRLMCRLPIVYIVWMECQRR